jgi:hypothetical protein
MLCPPPTNVLLNYQHYSDAYQTLDPPILLCACTWAHTTHTPHPTHGLQYVSQMLYHWAPADSPFLTTSECFIWGKQSSKVFFFFFLKYCWNSFHPIAIVRWVVRSHLASTFFYSFIQSFNKCGRKQIDSASVKKLGLGVCSKASMRCYGSTQEEPQTPSSSSKHVYVFWRAVEPDYQVSSELPIQ